MTTLFPSSCSCAAAISSSRSGGAICEIASASCSDNTAPSMGRQAVSASLPYIFCQNDILPNTISGCSRKYRFSGTPSAVWPTSTQLGIFSGAWSRFWKNRISAVTSVPALALNALFGRRIAPNKSAFWANISRTLLFPLSIVPFVVTKATMPPGRTLSSVFSIK